MCRMRSLSRKPLRSTLRGNGEINGILIQELGNCPDVGRDWVNDFNPFLYVSFAVVRVQTGPTSLHLRPGVYQRLGQLRYLLCTDGGRQLSSCSTLPPREATAYCDQ